MKLWHLGVQQEFKIFETTRRTTMSFDFTIDSTSSLQELCSLEPLSATSPLSALVRPQHHCYMPHGKFCIRTWGEESGSEGAFGCAASFSRLSSIRCCGRIHDNEPGEA